MYHCNESRTDMNYFDKNGGKTNVVGDSYLSMGLLSNIPVNTAPTTSAANAAVLRTVNQEISSQPTIFPDPIVNYQQNTNLSVNPFYGASDVFSQFDQYSLESVTWRQFLQQQQLQKQQQLVSQAAFWYQQQDEISKSLKMFAMLTASNNNGNESAHSPMDVMQDFATNGYSSDDLNQRYQQAAMLAKQNIGQYNVNTSAGQFGAYNPFLNQLHLQQQLQVNDERNNFWNKFPMQSLIFPNASVTPNNLKYVNSRKSYKRKYEKQGSSKHCVFCRNNNEPEAVVKSHAVRDSFGRVLCPKLRSYVCPICKASGDLAHTVKYCPQKLTNKKKTNWHAHRQWKLK